MMSQPKLWRYNLVWDKINRPTGFLDANRKPLRIHEDIAVFYKEQPTYNPQFTKGTQVHSRGLAGNSKGKGKNGCYGEFKFIPATITDEKYPVSIIPMNKEHNGDQFHPTQKPVNLLRYLVATYTNEGDTILDNCSGSGTTAIACIREKRNYIGFELNEEYYSKSLERIKDELSHPRLF